MKKKLIFLPVFILFAFCYKQKDEARTNLIVGEWKVVKINTKGYQRYTLEEANLLKSSTLVVTDSSFYYKNISFVDSCTFARWKYSSYDTVNLLGNLLDIEYRKKTLSKIIVVEPVDSLGAWGCYNNCSQFFMKDDTLINICGGYGFYLVRNDKSQTTQKCSMKQNKWRRKYGLNFVNEKK